MAPLLQIERCTKRFAALVANRDVSLAIGPREIVGLIGPNGAGKTSLFILDVLQMLHREEGLTVLLVEQNVHAALAAAERGYVLQTGRIVAEGTSQSLLDSDLVRRAYLGM